jgi:molybdopterin/thiamine biosynthesis adenylyltransferase
MILDINPDARVEAWSRPLDDANMDAFLDGADIAIDGLDILAVRVRRRLFRAARKSDIWALSAGPLGFGAAFLAFDPGGMSADTYFAFHDAMTPIDEFVAFVVGVGPAGLHLQYLDLAELDLRAGVGPSSGAACMMCGALVATETVALLTGKRTPRAAPRYAQWDLLRGKLVRGLILGGGKNPVQRLRRALFRRHLEKLGVALPSTARTSDIHQTPAPCDGEELIHG